MPLLTAWCVVLGAWCIMPPGVQQAANARQQKEIAWIGERVFPASAEVRLRGELGERAIVAEFRVVPGVVRRVEDYRLYVRSGSVEGWVLKSEVVPLVRAVEHFTRGVELAPGHAWAYNMRGAAWDEQGQHARALADFDQAIRLDPDNAIYFNNRGNAWAAQGELDRAWADFDHALRLDPEYADAYNNRGAIWADRRAYRRALADYSEAVRLDPRHALAFDNRGMAWANRGDYARARWDFEESLRLDPEYAPAYQHLARLLATCPDERHRDGKRAVDWACRACDLTGWGNADALQALAAAHAECGEFEAAVRFQDLAQLAERLTPEDRKPTVESVLQRYQRSQPLRAAPVRAPAQKPRSP